MSEPKLTSAARRHEWWIDADGLFVHAVEWDGTTGSARPTPVLLVHGLGGSTTNWLAVGAELATELRTRVLAVDLAGFGRTRPDGRPASLGTNGRLLEAVTSDRLQQSPVGAERCGPTVGASASEAGEVDGEDPGPKLGRQLGADGEPVRRAAAETVHQQHRRRAGRSGRAVPLDGVDEQAVGVDPPLVAPRRRRELRFAHPVNLGPCARAKGPTR